MMTGFKNIMFELLYLFIAFEQMALISGRPQNTIVLGINKPFRPTYHPNPGNNIQQIIPPGKPWPARPEDYNQFSQTTKPPGWTTSTTRFTQTNPINLSTSTTTTKTLDNNTSAEINDMISLLFTNNSLPLSVSNETSEISTNITSSTITTPTRVRTTTPITIPITTSRIKTKMSMTTESAVFASSTTELLSSSTTDVFLTQSIEDTTGTTAEVANITSNETSTLKNVETTTIKINDTTNTDETNRIGTVAHENEMIIDPIVLYTSKPLLSTIPDENDIIVAKLNLTLSESVSRNESDLLPNFVLLSTRDETSNNTDELSQSNTSFTENNDNTSVKNESVPFFEEKNVGKSEFEQLPQSTDSKLQIIPDEEIKHLASNPFFKGNFEIKYEEKFNIGNDNLSESPEELFIKMKNPAFNFQPPTFTKDTDFEIKNEEKFNAGNDNSSELPSSESPSSELPSITYNFQSPTFNKDTDFEIKNAENAGNDNSSESPASTESSFTESSEELFIKMKPPAYNFQPPSFNKDTDFDDDDDDSSESSEEFFNMKHPAYNHEFPFYKDTDFDIKNEEKFHIDDDDSNESSEEFFHNPDCHFDASVETTRAVEIVNPYIDNIKYFITAPLFDRHAHGRIGTGFDRFDSRSFKSRPLPHKGDFIHKHHPIIY